MSPEAHAIRQGWIDALEGLETDLANDRNLLDHGVLPSQPSVWEPPHHLGPIPIELRERASGILAELGKSARRLNELKLATGQQLSAVRSIPPARENRSVYLDTTG